MNKNEWKKTYFQAVSNHIVKPAFDRFIILGFLLTINAFYLQGYFSESLSRIINGISVKNFLSIVVLIINTIFSIIYIREHKYFKTQMNTFNKTVDDKDVKTFITNVKRADAFNLGLTGICTRLLLSVLITMVVY